MSQIGTFARGKDGFSGHLQTLTLNVELTIVPTDRGGADSAPDYRIHAGDDTDGPEVGAGWTRTGEKAGEYLSLLIDDPAFAQPIHANLFKSNRDGNAYHLLWTRPMKRGERA